MIDFSTINDAGELFGVALKSEPTLQIDENGVEFFSYLRGLGYWSGLPLDVVVAVTTQVFPLGEPYFILLRSDIPIDYDSNADFIATLDFSNPDGYGTRE